MSTEYAHGQAAPAPRASNTSHAGTAARTSKQPVCTHVHHLEELAVLLRGRPSLNDLLTHLVLVSLAHVNAVSAALHEYVPDRRLEPLAAYGISPAGGNVGGAASFETLAEKAPSRGRQGARIQKDGQQVYGWALQPPIGRLRLLSVSVPRRHVQPSIQEVMAHLLPVIELAATSPAGLGNPASTLTARQAAVLAGMADGLTDRQIAGRLGFSESTIGLEARRIYRALGVAGRQQAVAEAARRALLRTPARPAAQDSGGA